MPYPAYKVSQIQYIAKKTRRPDKRSASGNYTFVIRLEGLSPLNG